jgi:UDP-N-acetylmuramyl tripeptide synthase
MAIRPGSSTAGSESNDAPLPHGPARAVIPDALVGAAARSCGRLVRTARLGAGTSLPGRLADRLGPGFLERRAAALPHGVIVVSGTNGKTTTAAMILAILRENGMRAVANDSGANMSGGVVGAFLDAPREAQIAVLEVDEGALPALTRRLRPRVMVLTNIFRDQLDRFAEPERVGALLSEAVGALPPGASVIANADDPVLWRALHGADASPVGFGLTGVVDATAQGSAGEPSACPRCGAGLEYSYRTLAHLGSARCRTCSWRSQAPSHAGRIVAEGGLHGLVLEEGDAVLTLPMGGVHNAYNAVAALATARALALPRAAAIAALERFRPRFGRSEDIEFGGRPLWLGLIKNPAGTGAILRSIAHDQEVGAVVISINDRDADGRDVSWIWDADFERLTARGIPLIPAGRRAEEMALRLKYAGAAPAPAEREPLRAISSASDRCADGRMVAVLATYTAMLEARHSLLGRRSARVRDAA